RLRQGARQADRRARAAKGSDGGMAVQDLGAAITNGARIVAEDRVQGRDVVADECFFVAFEGGGHLGDDVGQVDFGVPGHFFFPGFASLTTGVPAATAPPCSSACAMRSAISSRQGAAMIWMPIGKGLSGTGTATTGRPMKEIGWV